MKVEKEFEEHQNCMQLYLLHAKKCLSHLLCYGLCSRSDLKKETILKQCTYFLSSIFQPEIWRIVTSLFGRYSVFHIKNDHMYSSMWLHMHFLFNSDSVKSSIFRCRFVDHFLRFVCSTKFLVLAGHSSLSSEVAES